jgi:Group II intron, maturase-specific domain/MOSC N-terminal beta barrel domain
MSQSAEEAIGTVVSLWRYPVKSMMGEELNAAEVSERGLLGDRGWANYFKHAVAKHTLDRLQAFVWWRIITWVKYRHRMSWKAIRRWFKGPTGWRPIALDGIELFSVASVPVTRYRWRGTKILSPWPTPIIEPTA